MGCVISSPLDILRHQSWTVSTRSTILCVECGSDLIFSVADQEYHASKGFDNDPKRCSTCRQRRGAERGTGGYSSRPLGRGTPSSAPSTARTLKCPSGRPVPNQSIAVIASTGAGQADTRWPAEPYASTDKSPGLYCPDSLRRSRDVSSAAAFSDVPGLSSGSPVSWPVALPRHCRSHRSDAACTGLPG